MVYLQEEVFVNISGIKFRAMFGGYGVYKDDKIFGMVANDVLYFKVNENNKPDYKKFGSKPFTYSKNGKSYAMSYWEVPEFVLSNVEELESWMNKSLNIK